jgi:hypothetical protein
MHNHFSSTALDIRLDMGMKSSPRFTVLRTQFGYIHPEEGCSVNGCESLPSKTVSPKVSHMVGI